MFFSEDARSSRPEFCEGFVICLNLGSCIGGVVFRAQGSRFRVYLDPNSM